MQKICLGAKFPNDLNDPGEGLELTVVYVQVFQEAKGSVTEG